MRVLLDTNILLDYYTKRPDFFDSAEKIINLCLNQEVEGVIAAHSKAGEDRYVVIGDIGKFIIIVVVYTDKNGVERMITARPAEPIEEAQYYENIRRTLGRN